MADFFGVCSLLCLGLSEVRWGPSPWWGLDFSGVLRDSSYDRRDSMDREYATPDSLIKLAVRDLRSLSNDSMDLKQKLQCNSFKWFVPNNDVYFDDNLVKNLSTNCLNS